VLPPSLVTVVASIS